MASTFTELKKRLDLYVDDTVDDATALMLFNACNEDISEPARYAYTKEATFDKDVSVVTLPIGVIKIVELKIKLDGESAYRRIYPINLVQPLDLVDGSEWPYSDDVVGYEWWGDAVEIRPAQTKNGKLLVRYFGQIPAIASLSEAPKIPPMYHDLYPLFAAIKYYQGYQDEITAKRDVQGEYADMRTRLDQYTMNLENKTKSKTAYVMRPWR